MALLNNYKIRASSITESIIAMVIIAICLSIAIVVYVRVLDTDRNIASYKAEQKVKELLLETTSRKQFQNEDYSYPSFIINKDVEELSEERTYKIVFTVKAGNIKNKYQYIVAY